MLVVVHRIYAPVTAEAMAEMRRLQGLTSSGHSIPACLFSKAMDRAGRARRAVRPLQHAGLIVTSGGCIRNANKTP